MSDAPAEKHDEDHDKAEAAKKAEAAHKAEEAKKKAAAGKKEDHEKDKLPVPTVADAPRRPKVTIVSKPERTPMEMSNGTKWAIGLVLGGLALVGGGYLIKNSMDDSNRSRYFDRDLDESAELLKTRLNNREPLEVFAANGTISDLSDSGKITFEEGSSKDILKKNEECTPEISRKGAWRKVGGHFEQDWTVIYETSLGQAKYRIKAQIYEDNTWIGEAQLIH